MTYAPEDGGWAELLARVAAERGLDFEPQPAALIAALSQLHEHVGRLVDELADPPQRRWLAAALAAMAHQVEAASIAAAEIVPDDHDQAHVVSLSDRRGRPCNSS
ncbi:MAG: hypothetical protein L0K86_00105 [Actinomycetia bacterium]|nr:hypothetical protein [Actinomycetes bacterium]